MRKKSEDKSTDMLCLNESGSQNMRRDRDVFECMWFKNIEIVKLIKKKKENLNAMALKKVACGTFCTPK